MQSQTTSIPNKQQTVKFQSRNGSLQANQYAHLAETFGPQSIIQKNQNQNQTQNQNYPQQKQFQLQQDSQSTQYQQFQQQGSRQTSMSQQSQQKEQPQKQYQQFKTKNQQPLQQVSQTAQPQSLKQSHQFQYRQNLQVNNSVNLNKISQNQQSQDRTALQNVSNHYLQSPGQALNIQYYNSNGGSVNKPSNPVQTTPLKEKQAFQLQSPPQNSSYAQQFMYYENINEDKISSQYSPTPIPKNYSLKDNSVLLRPSTQPVGKQSLMQARSPQVQRLQRVGVNSTGSNTQTLIDQLNKEKETNKTLMIRLKKAESDQKGQNTQLLNELEKRIKLLIQQNDSLQTLNQELNNKLASNTHEQEKLQIEQATKKLKQDIQMLENQHHIVLDNINEQKDKCQELQNQIDDIETSELEEEEIKSLILDLEEKVQGLILENERLNNLLLKEDFDTSKSNQINYLTQEKQKLQMMILVNKKENDQWKNKYDDLLKKYSHLENDRVDSKVSSQQVQELERQIKQLITENDELNNIVQQQIVNENQISCLEDQMQQLVEENELLEKDLLKWKLIVNGK